MSQKKGSLSPKYPSFKTKYSLQEDLYIHFINFVNERVQDPYHSKAYDAMERCKFIGKAAEDFMVLNREKCIDSGLSLDKLISKYMCWKGNDLWYKRLLF